MSDMPYIDNGRVIITTKFAVSVLKPKGGMLKPTLEEKIPGIQWDGQRKVWWVTAQENSVAVVNKVFKLGLKSNAPAVRSHILAFPFKTQPREVQLKALEAAACRPYFGYVMEPGLGKTATAIYEMEILNRDNKVTDVIVTCPKSIIGTWLREIGTHGHYEQWEIYRWDADSSKPHVEQVHAPESGEPTMRWFITNIDSINHPAGWRAAYSFVMRSNQCAMIVDESSTIKNMDAKRTLQALILGEQCKYRRILNGTLIAHTPMDVFAQFTFLDTSIFYGWSFATFRGHYAITGGYKQREIYGYTNQDELAHIIGQHTYRATKEEWLDLPPRIFQTREITLSKGTWKLYDQIANDMVVQLSEEKAITVDMVAKRIIKLRQLVGGWVLEDKDAVPPGVKRQALSMCTEKLEDFMGYVDEARGTKGIVWCQFTHEILNLYEVLMKMGFKVVKYHGDMKTKERDAAENAFERGDAQIILVQNDTGSMGLTLNAASWSYMYSNPSYLLFRQQLTERNYRDGQTKSVTFIDAVCIGTVDQALHEGLQSGKEISDLVMEASAHKNMEALKGILYPKRISGGWKGKKQDA